MHHIAQELHIGRQAHDVDLRERFIESSQSFGTRVAVHDQLGDHGVVVRTDGVTLAHAFVNTHTVVRAGKAAAPRLLVGAKCARGRQEILVWIFGTDARLNRMALYAQISLCYRQSLARRHSQLPFDQIMPRDGLGHWMLHLQTGVHLHEVELHLLRVCVATRLLYDEFNRTCSHIVHSTRRFNGCLAHAGTQLGRHTRCRCFFQHLLVSTLDGAVSLKQVHIVALGVTKHLNLNMAWALHVFLNQYGVVTKAVDGFALARCQRRCKVLGLVHRTHALATATRTGLDQHGVTYVVGLALQQRWVLIRSVVARHQWHAGFFHQLFGLGLQTHGLNGRSWWPDEDHARRSAGLREFFVLTQKTIAWVNCLCASGNRRVNDAFPAQVAVFG